MIIDLGPNGLWEFYESESLDEYIQFRFTINSIAMENDDIGGWTELIREQDKQWIAMTDLERFELTQQYSHRAFENVLLDYLMNIMIILTIKNMLQNQMKMVGMIISELLVFWHQNMNC